MSPKAAYTTSPSGPASSKLIQEKRSSVDSRYLHLQSYQVTVQKENNIHNHNLPHHHPVLLLYPSPTTQPISLLCTDPHKHSPDRSLCSFVRTLFEPQKNPRYKTKKEFTKQENKYPRQATYSQPSLPSSRSGSKIQSQSHKKNYCKSTPSTQQSPNPLSASSQMYPSTPPKSSTIPPYTARECDQHTRHRGSCPA
jgi:hypothetical protein